ncbi:MAG: UDP-N-acetylmuramoyl-L-alanine--D-glutamate ligase [Actinomycetes bacterium]|jgi:UDP-N-acetylmuramoylalanine--D-glutamate ligase|nr:UDP-N-acetylmuramoyl-L-alanine--D-glutamate ligase [Actinomycetes bacterium]
MSASVELFANQDILICGMGVSGQAALRWFECCSEARGVTTVADVDEVEGSFDVAVMSPGIAPHTALFRSAIAAATELISEPELAWRVAPKTITWVAITGTNGKTTTVSLLTHLLEGAGIAAVSVGNIGMPPTEALLRVAEGLLPSNIVFVCEMSSFQLELSPTFAPGLAAVLNISPDHEDWHGSFAAYRDAKLRLARQTGQAGGMVLWGEELQGDEDLVSELSLVGEHNRQNARVAIGLARELGAADAALVAGLRSFQAGPHRLQFVATRRGVDYYDDSKATNPGAVLKALTAFPDREITLLVGGRNKGIDFCDFAAAALPLVTRVLCFGEAGAELSEAFGAAARRYASMEEAVAAATELTGLGGVVLLSPANTSWDQFASYQERGRAFAQQVDALAEEATLVELEDVAAGASATFAGAGDSAVRRAHVS